MNASSEQCEDVVLAAGCGGADCMIEVREAGTKLLSPDRRTILLDLPAAWPLGPQGRAPCNSALPVLGADGSLSLYSLADQRLLHRYDLGDLVSPDGFMIAVASSSSLSCDGQRLFLMGIDGPGWQLIKLSSETEPTLQVDAFPVVAFAASGRYAIQLANDPKAPAMLHDYVEDRTGPVALRFELDVPFFDRDERYLVIRHSSDLPVTASIYRLADFEFIETIEVEDQIDWTDLAVIEHKSLTQLRSGLE